MRQSGERERRSTQRGGGIWDNARRLSSGSLSAGGISGVNVEVKAIP